ncbi:MAG: hypothetical protein GOVbin655_39 [Prokaryotic dsDNA virus sp.]|nr:MAG: hypothetical protein GOVbin655_39 [Prokaryotic dsDNA virus sp.]|tara:strand:+ start:693 stop:9227 length:8535 start_codon:yes stop_codon:yes gene_type:complete
MGLREDFLELLENNEEQSSSTISPYTNIFAEPEKPKKQTFEGGALYDTVGRGLWSYFDEALFGVPSIAEKRGFEAELFEEPEGIIEKTFGAVGSLAGFITGAPIKVGAKIASTVAKPVIKKAGFKSVADVIKEGTEKVLEKGTGDGIQLGIKQISDQLPSWSKHAEWNKNLADNWADFSKKSLNETVDNLGPQGRKLIGQRDADILKSQFGKVVSEERPMQDFIDLYMRTSKTFDDPHYKFAIGHMLHEAVMFGAIDSIFELSRSIADDRAYDWTAPLWGLGTGTLFGTLKFLPRSGKQSSSQSDFLQGLKSWIGKSDSNVGAMSPKNLVYTMKSLGDDIVSRYGKETSKHIVDYVHNGKKYQIDLTDATSYLEAEDIIPNEWGVAMRAALREKQKEIGLEMMEWARKESFQQISENWMHMVGGTIFMNARSFWEMSRGHDVPLDDIALNVMLGAYLNRRGAPRVQDFNYNMRRMRSQLDILGVGSKNYFDRVPTMGDGATNPFNPLNHPDFNQMNKFAEENNWKSDMYLESPLQPGEVSAKASPKDLGIFNTYYDYLTGIKGRKYTIPKDYIPESQAIEIQNKLKKTKIDGEYIKDRWDLETKLQGIKNDMSDALQKKLSSFTHSILKDGTDYNVSIPNAAGELGIIPKRIEIDPKLIDKAMKGDFPWLIDGEGAPLKDVGAKSRIMEFKRKMNVLLETQLMLPGNTPDKKSTNITSEVKLQEFVIRMLQAEKGINKGFRVNPNYEFKMEDLSDLGMRNPILQRYYRKAEDNFNENLDIKNDNFYEFANIFKKRNIFSSNDTDIAGFRIPDNPWAQIGFKDTEGHTAEQLHRGKKFLTNIIRLMGSKGQVDVDSNINQKELNFSVVKEIQSALQQRGLVSDINVVNNFAESMIQRNFMHSVRKSNMNMADIDVLTTLMDKGMVKFGAKGAINRFSFKEMPDPGAIAETKVRQAYKDYNEMKQKLLTNGKVDGDKNIIAIDSETIPLGKGDIIELGAQARLYLRGEGSKATEYVADLINSISRTDQSLRDSIIELQNKYPELMPEIHKFLTSKGVIMVDKDGYSKKGLVKYIYDTQIIGPDTEVRKDFEKWLEVNHNVSIKDIAATRKESLNKVNKMISESTFAEGDSKKTQSQFYDTYFNGNLDWDKTDIHTTQAQNSMIKRIVFDSNLNVRKTAIPDFVKELDTVKISDKQNITGKELMDNLKKNPNQWKDTYKKVASDVLNLIIPKIAGKQIKVVGMQSGKMTENIESKAITNLDEALKSQGYKDEKWGYVDLTVPEYGTFAGKIIKQYKSIGELESNQTSSAAKKRLVKIKQDFHVFLDRMVNGDEGLIKTKDKEELLYDSDLDRVQSGVSLLRIGNGKHAIFMSKDQAAKVANNWFDNVYDPYINHPATTRQQKNSLEAIKAEIIDGYEKNANNPEEVKKGKSPRFNDGDLQWPKLEDSSLDMAWYQTILADMMQGKTKSGEKTVFQESWSYNPQEIRDKIAKRFTLYDSKKFYKMTKDLVEVAYNGAIGSERRNIGKYMKRGAANMVVWDDDFGGDIAERLQNQFNIAWKDIGGIRGSTTGFDSISFISKDFRDFNQYMLGADKDQTAFKPVISSRGKNEVMYYGKTVFLYNPDMQKDVFSKNKNLDILTSRSADKLKSAPKILKRKIDDVLAMKGSEFDDFMIPINLDKIGLKSFEKFKPASNSYSKYHFMSSQESNAVFKSMYQRKIKNSVEAMEMVASEPMHMNNMIKQLKHVDPELTYEVLADMTQGAEGAAKSHGELLRLFAMDPNARPEILGEDQVWNLIKGQFIDNVLEQKSTIGTGESAEQYGGKSVLAQSFHLRDLKPSRQHVGGNEGEMYLPYEAGISKLANLGNMKIKAKGKDNKLVDAYKIYSDFMKDDNPDAKDSDIKSEWDELDLIQLDAALKSYDADVNLMGLVTRYPRTRPNDLAMLKIKGFLSKEHGNQVIVNDFDVYKIFEGDYDVDKVDYWWAHDDATFSHVNRMKKNWVVDAPVEQLLDKNLNQNLKVMPDADKVGYTTMKAWNELDADSRVMDKNIGKVQKMLRSVEWMYNNVASDVHVDGKGRKLFEFPSPDGKVEIYMDLGKDWYSRFAMEAQGLIDYFKPADADGPVSEFSERFLNPKAIEGGQEFSVTQSELSKRNQSEIGFDSAPNLLDEGAIPRIRTFQKFVNGKPENQLNPVDFLAVQKLLQHFGDFTQLSTKLYEPGGNGRKAGYNDTMEIAGNYFSGLAKMTENLGREVASKFAYKGPYAEYAKQMFNLKAKIYSKDKKRIANKYDDLSMDDVALNPERFTYFWPDNARGPFTDDVLSNMTAISKGKRGTILERSMYQFEASDPLKSRYKQDEYLSGEQVTQLNQISLLLSKDADWATDQMQEIIPKAFKGIKDKVSSVLYLKRQQKYVQSNYKLSKKIKDRRLKGIDRAIKKLEKELGGVLPNTFKGRALEAIKDIKMTNIYSNKEVRRATSDLYTFWHYVKELNYTGTPEQWKKINEIKAISGKDYSEHFNLGQSQDYNHMTIKDKTQIDRSMYPIADSSTIEDIITKRIIDGVNDHGTGFLALLGMPKTGAMSWGVFEGTAMPTAIKPSNMTKRVIRFALNTVDMDPTLFKNGENTKNEIKTFLEDILQRDAYYDAFFSGNVRYLPNDPNEMNQYLNSIPKMDSSFKAFIGRNYSDFNFRHHAFENHIFGNTKEYQNSVDVYKSILNVFGGSESAFDSVTTGLSKLNEISMDLGVVDPVSYALMVDNFKKELDGLGFGDALKHAMTIKGKKVEGNEILQTDPLVQMMVGNGGFSLDPVKMLSPYKISQLKKFLKQATDVARTPLGGKNRLEDLKKKIEYACVAEK